MSVPLDWSNPTGPRIALALVRHLAARPESRIGSLFFNPGGPGVSGVSTVKTAGAELDKLGSGRFDVVSWDPRGTGASTHVSCFANKGSLAAFWDHTGIPTNAPASVTYLQKMTDFAHRCGKVSGALLGNITTAESARDLDYLRALLGEEKLTYLGWSYGSFLGITYANMFPTRVRAMVFDGIVDPVPYVAGREPFLANTEIDTDAVFKKFESLCERAGASRCTLARHEPVAQGIERLLARLRASPIPARSAPGGRLSYGDFLTALFGMLRSPAMWPDLATNIRAAENGDGSPLETVALEFRSPSFYELLEPAIAIACADSPARQPARSWPRVIDRLTDVSFIYGPVQGWWLWAPCASWPVESSSRYTGPWNARTETPILITSTTHDPNTPFVNGRRVEHLLGTAILLTHDGYGHVSTSDPSACVERAQQRYLVSLVVPKRGTVCSSDREPFDPKFGDQ